MKKVTLYDVAKQAGVSPKTVSRVINNEASVSDQKRQVVLGVVKKLGYKPNNSARSLRNKRAYSIALLYDNLSPAYILDLQAGLLSVCEEAHYNLLIKDCNFNNKVLIDQVSELLENTKVDGFVLSPPISDNKRLIKLLLEKQCPFVRIAPLDGSLISPFVLADDCELAREVTDYLIGLGHERIAFIAGDKTHSASIERLAGYKQALESASISFDEELLEQGDFSFESGEQCALNLLDKAIRPSAIFASNDYMAAGVMKVAQKLGLTVPNDLSVVGFDDAPVSSQLWPTLTTVKQPVKEIAAQSATLLLDAINNKEAKHESVKLHCELVVRESTSS